MQPVPQLLARVFYGRATMVMHQLISATEGERGARQKRIHGVQCDNRTVDGRTDGRARSLARSLGHRSPKQKDAETVTTGDGRFGHVVSLTIIAPQRRRSLNRTTVEARAEFPLQKAISSVTTTTTVVTRASEKATSTHAVTAAAAK